MLSFYFTYREMSAKKSASNIRSQDRKEFDAKLQALHQQLITKFENGVLPTKKWTDFAIEYFELQCKCNAVHPRIPWRNTPNILLSWCQNAETSCKVTYVSMPDIHHVQKKMQEHYTNGEDRTIGNVVIQQGAVWVDAPSWCRGYSFDRSIYNM